MQDKYIELRNLVKMHLDRRDATREAEEFVEELQDKASSLKIGLDSKSLKEIESIFNEEITRLGKTTSIKLSNVKVGKEALRDMAAQFVNVISDSVQTGFKKGIAKIDVGKIDTGIDKQIKELKEKRQELLKQYRETEKLITNKTSIHRINDGLGENKKLTLSGDLVSHTEGAIKKFNEASNKMKTATKGSEEYKAAVFEAQDALDDLYRLQHEYEKQQENLITKNKELSEVIRKNLYAKKPKSEDLAKEELLTKEVGKLKGINFKDQIDKITNIIKSDDSTTIQNAFDGLSVELDEINKELSTTKAQMLEIDKQINELENNTDTLKNLEQIEKAYDRILNKRSKASNKIKENIATAINYDESDQTMSLTKLANGYNRSELEGEDWEEQYIWLVKFVKEYDKYLAEKRKKNPKYDPINDPRANPGHYELYTKLKPKVEDAEKSLRTLHDLTSGKIQPSQVVDNKEKVHIKKESADATERQAQAQSNVADAAEREKKATEEILKIEEKRQKLLLYRRVEGKFNPDLVGSENGDNITDIEGTLESGFGAFGDGLFASTKAGAKTLAKDGDVSFFEFDASKYNLYINNTLEEAEKLRSFLWNLQRIIGDGSPFEFDDRTWNALEEDGINRIDEGQLYERLKELFKDSNMSKEQFMEWIKNAQNESRKIHSDFAKGIDPSNAHNFGTRFMQQMGYEGVLNDIKDDPDYSGDYQGSVIYEPDTKEIIAYINSTKHVFDNINDYLQYLSALETPDIQVPSEVDTPSKKVEQTDGEQTIVAGNQKKIESAVDTTKQAVDGLNTSLEKKNQLEATSNVSTEVDEENKKTIAVERHTQALKDNFEQMAKNTNADVDKKPDVKLVDYALKTTSKNASKSTIPSTQQNDGNNIGKQIVSTFRDFFKKSGNLIAQENTLKDIRSKIEDTNSDFDTRFLTKRSNGLRLFGDQDFDIRNPKEFGFLKATKVDTKVKELQGLYEQRGRLLAQNSFEFSQETQEEINQLNKSIQLKFKELKLEDDKRKALKQSLMIRQEDAKQSEKNLLIARQADQIRKQANKDEKANLRAEMKDVRDKSRITKASSTWRSGKDVYGLTMNMVDEDNDIFLENVLAHEDIQSLYNELDLLENKTKEVNEVLKNKDNYTEKQVDEYTKSLQKQTAATQQQIKVVKELQKNYEFFSGDNSKSLNQVYTGGDLESQLKQAIMLATNGKAKFHEYNATLGQWTYSVNGANNETKNYTAGLRGLDNQLRTVHTSTKKTESLFESIKRKTKEVFTYFSGSSMVYKLFGELRKGIQYIREIDSALTELKKVTDETEETYDKFLDTASKTAAKVGSTIKEVVSSTADFARLGYSLKEAAEFAESAQILMNVSEFTDVSRATDTLISAVQAFGYTAETSMEVVDLLNMIGKIIAYR